MSDDLDQLFNADTHGDTWSDRLTKLLTDPTVSQITINRHDRVFYTQHGKVMAIPELFPGRDQYISWLNGLMRYTDVGYEDVSQARTSVIEGSFDPTKTTLHGSIHISTKEITRDQPGLTVRKQPRDIVTLDDMISQQMMSPEMGHFIRQAVRARANILVSGGSGAGKTTILRALSAHIDPNHRVITVEEIDELHLADRLPNVMALTTYKDVDAEGRIVRTTELADLVREALRMRGDRIWVGETRGREAYALVKACNSGHDGSITTMHADTASQAIHQVVTYVMEAGVTETVARDQVANAFHLVIQIGFTKMNRRVVTQISELEPVREEGTQQRINPLFRYNSATDSFEREGLPTTRLQEAWQRYGVSPADLFGQPTHPSY